MENRPLHEIELEAWSQRAAFYGDVFAHVSSQAMDPILDSLGNLHGLHHLDTACGTGHLVAAAARRGALSQGTDFAQPMVDTARRNYPGLPFDQADATELPFAGESFDAVTCSFGLSHMEFPQKAIQEAWRMLRTGGRFVFTLWYGPDDGGELMALGRDAVKAHAVNPPSLPDTWTQLRFADEARCLEMLTEAGFERPHFQRLPVVLRVERAEAALDVLDKLSVRTKMIFDSQTDEVRQRIRDQITTAAEARRTAGVIVIPFPALLTTARKSGGVES